VKREKINYAFQIIEFQVFPNLFKKQLLLIISFQLNYGSGYVHNKVYHLIP